MHQTGTIADVKQDVLDALQQRTDVPDSQIAYYVARQAKELTESYPFPELETTGPTVQLTQGVAIYPVAQFLNSTSTYSMPSVMVLYIDPPNNTVSIQVKYKTPAAIETLIAPAVMGIPAWFTRFGSNFHFGPVPQQNYTVFLRYQEKHPFSTTPQITDPLYIPTSWYDILAYGAAMRICVPKRWTDQRQMLHDALFGDPEFQMSDGKKGRPGMIAARTFQIERDQANNSRNVNIVVGRYNQR